MGARQSKTLDFEGQPGPRGQEGPLFRAPPSTPSLSGQVAAPAPSLHFSGENEPSRVPGAAGRRRGPFLGGAGCSPACLDLPLKNEGWPIGSKLTGDLGHGWDITP